MTILASRAHDHLARDGEKAEWISPVLIDLGDIAEVSKPIGGPSENSNSAGS